MGGIGDLDKPKAIDKPQHFEVLASKWHLWLNGFLVNTVNPFTIIFWTTIVTTFAIEQPLYSNSSALYFGGILGVIIVTDGLKIILAERISNHLKPIHIANMRRISGMALFLFGIILFIRVFGEF